MFIVPLPHKGRSRWDEAAKQWQATAQPQFQQSDLERLTRIQQQVNDYERAEQARQRQQQRQRGMDLER